MIIHKNKKTKKEDLKVPSKKSKKEEDGNGGVPVDDLQVQLAVSSRSKCQICGSKIDKETIRIGIKSLGT